MQTAFECFEHAAICEEQAYHATTDIGRGWLLETAKHWRTLGEKAQDSKAMPRIAIPAVPPKSAVRPKTERTPAKRRQKLQRQG